ncbi:hypothetical protein [Secundilactobacillus kimchicus]|uniref:hypothetical protein n=1 Tax=Secundilactobacillus kimchicus TaxID=528209 RepID=UPI0024A91921|nr:hypothetical protein [Secundilactobacillus kimchicus]
MLKKQLMMWGIVSWGLFTAVNLAMSLPLVRLSHGQSTMLDFWKVTAISLVLYLLPLIWGAAGHNSGFYILGLVIAVYTIATANVIIAMVTGSSATMLVKTAMIVGAVVVIGVNLYWLILGFRYRKTLDEKRDDALYHKLNERHNDKQKEVK